MVASAGRLADLAESLRVKIESRNATVAVVGLGYVGLTVACALAARGYRVLGIEKQRERVQQVNLGVCPMPQTEPGLPSLLAEHVRAERLTATTEHAALVDADITLVAVDTPVDSQTKAPDLSTLEGAVESVGCYMRPGTLAVVESTVPPGTTRDLVVPLLEGASRMSADEDFLVGCCPERVMPGKLLANLAHCDRVFGGWNREAAEVGAAFYATLTGGRVDVSDCLTAEIVKTTENAYRDVQIAFANEVALLCEDYGADVYRVRDLVNRAPYRDMHIPGAGVGGHCIPKDPWLLVASSTRSAQLILAARSINDSMPHHTAQIASGLLAERGRRLDESRIVVLGYAYLADSDDVRNSPSAELVAWLSQRGASVAIHDPFVPEYAVDLDQAVQSSDCLIGMVAHTAYRSIDLPRIAEQMRTRVLVDGRRMFDPQVACAAGFVYRCLGNGSTKLPTI
jgi:UDP-N-acetyl-D-mannosaminuronic acid dehydrogenase